MTTPHPQNPADRQPRYRPYNRDTLRVLLERTGDGTRASIRDIADATGVHHSFICKVLTGEQDNVSADVAAAWSARQGCDLLMLWVPVERTTTARTGVLAGAAS